jgi:hypothetical protein
MRKLLATLAIATSLPAHAQWEYEKYSDQMDGGNMTQARAVSTNSVQQDFPYDGLTAGAIFVRQFADKFIDVTYAITKGQLMCGPVSCKVRVRFDDGPPVSFRAVPSDSGSLNLINITDTKRFLRQARNAKTIRIQASMYKAGAPVMHFNLPTPLKMQ